MPSSEHSGRTPARAVASVVILLAAVLALRASLQSAASDPGLIDGPGVVMLRDGKSIEGEIIEREDEVTVSANGIVTTLTRSQVQAIEYGTPEARLRRRLAGARTADERLAVGETAFGRGLLDLAQEVAQEVSDGNPLNERAITLLEQVELQRRLRRASGQGTSRADGEAGPRTLIPTPDNRLTEDQINLVRQAELQDADAMAGRESPRINFRDGVLKRFTDGQIYLDFREFNGFDDVSKALYILRESRDELMREDVRITSHPRGIMEYLRDIEPIILNGCATSQCHGGVAAPSFALYGKARDDSVSYTNFYLLNTRTVRIPATQGVFEGEEAVQPIGRLIDRARPDGSLLLSYMLPRKKTRMPHPLVEHYDGLVLSSDDEHYQMVRRWIAQGLGPSPVRGYGFDFQIKLPTTRPSSQPASD